MTAPSSFNGRQADKRVAVPIIARPNIEPPRERQAHVQMAAVARPAAVRSSLLSNMTLQADVAVAGPINQPVPQETAPLTTPMQWLVRNSDADAPHVAQAPIGTPTGNVNPPRPSFSTDLGPNGGHYVRISGIKESTVLETQRALYSSYKWSEKLLGSRSSGEGDTFKMYLRFDSIEEAAQAGEQVSMALPGAQTDPVPFHEYATAEGGPRDDGQFYDGQVIFTAKFIGPISQLNKEDAYLEFEKMTSLFDGIRASEEVRQTATTVEFRVEFDRISGARLALAAVSTESPYVNNGWMVTTKEIMDPLKSRKQMPDVITQSPSGRSAWSVDANGNLVVKQPTQSLSQLFKSMAIVPFQPAQQLWPVMCGGYDVYDHYGRSAQPYQSYQPYDDRHSSADIYLEDIREGHDVRTTIMVRNIPNSWSYAELKDRMDEYCHGLYDFSYLRIDFKEGTNVGYGFVNFTRAVDIIPLHEGLFQKPWVRGGKGRKCNMSYATVQGIDCLIEKFRNSSIMDEAPPYKAKLWWTTFDVNDTESANEASASSNTQMVKSSGGATHFVTPDMVGTERPFPPPDNETKHQRSNANAANSELYPGARGGLITRGGRRGRRGGFSNYDRGTTHQMHEEFFQALPMPYGYFPVVPPQLMMSPYYQQHHPVGYGNNHYQHHSGPGYAANHRQYKSSARGAPRDGFMSNDARNDARMPRSFEFEDSHATSSRGGFNKRGGRIYT